MLACACATAMLAAVQAQAATKRPSILVIWGDDIGGFNINLDRVMEAITKGAGDK